MADNSILIHNHLLNDTGIMPFENNRLWNIPGKNPEPNRRKHYI